ncbi:MAG: ATP-binding protein [Eubacteriales bacterium]|nr:ATP-binding protein [Eubacteriales bacterium]
MHIETPIVKDDFASAGEASSKVKKTLTMLGVKPSHIKRISVAMYEAEINAFIHGGGGMAYTDIYPDHVVIFIEDHGKGIEDISLAMQEGYSTASDEVRMMGFGAGMGLPNMKRNSDDMVIDSSPGNGTRVKMTFDIR